MSKFDGLVFIVVAMVSLKALTIGSNFNWLKWFKYGDKYRNWYLKHEAEKFNEKL